VAAPGEATSVAAPGDAPPAAAHEEAFVPAEAVQAAERILADRIRRYPPAWLEEMGFASEQEALEATVGDPLPGYGLSARDLAEGVATVAEATWDQATITFIVSGGGRPVARLTVIRRDGAYKFLEFGGSGEHLQRGLSALPARSGVRLLHMGPAEFLYLNHEGTEYLVYVGGGSFYGMESFQPYTYEQIRPELQKWLAGCRRQPDPELMGFCPPAPEPLHPAFLAVAATAALGLVAACIQTFRRLARM